MLTIFVSLALEVLSAAEGTAQTPQQAHEQHQHKASRIRGGGAGKVRGQKVISSLYTYVILDVIYS
jgi:hypothetical protein